MGVSPRRLGPTLGFLVLALFLTMAPTSARITWCKRDPIVQIAGQTVNITISSLQAMNEAATGPTEVVVTVPAGVEAVLRATDQGFGHHGYDVRFEESSVLKTTKRSLQIQVEVFAPANDDTLPVKVNFSPRGDGPLRATSAEGTANTWITLTSGVGGKHGRPKP